MNIDAPDPLKEFFPSDYNSRLQSALKQNFGSRSELFEKFSNGSVSYQDAHCIALYFANKESAGASKEDFEDLLHEILPGWNLEEIAPAPARRIIKSVSSPAPLPLPWPSETWPQLFPSNYSQKRLEAIQAIAARHRGVSCLTALRQGLLTPEEIEIVACFEAERNLLEIQPNVNQQLCRDYIQFFTAGGFGNLPRLQATPV